VRTSGPLDPELRAAADSALREIGRIGRVERNQIYDHALNAALDPLRRLTLGSACGSCSHDTAWCALDSTVAFVAAFQRRCPPKQRRGGIADCFDPDPSPIGHARAPWILLAETGKTSVTLVDVSTPGYPIRLRITCPRCGAEHITTNTTRLKQFVTTVSRGERKIWLSK
jgi:hypothetical protein